MICVLGCRSKLRRDFTPLQRAIPTIQRSGHAEDIVLNHRLQQNNRGGEFSHLKPSVAISADQLRDACEVNDSCPAMHAAAGRRAERGRSERDYDEGHATCFRDIP